MAAEALASGTSGGDGATAATPYYVRPVLPLLFSLIAGLCIGYALPIYPAAGLIGIAAAARIFYHLARRTPARFSPLILLAVSGYFAIMPWLSPFFPPPAAQHFLGAKPVRVRARIASRPQTRWYRTVCELDDLAVTGNGSRPVKLPGRIRMTVYGKPPALATGDRIALTGAIRRFKNFNNPGGFDYRQFMAFKNTWGNVHIRAKRLTVQRSGSGGLTAGLDRFRETIDAAIAKVGDRETSAVLSALLIGNRKHISNRLRNDFNRAGVSHLLAISGLHIGIVALAAFFLFNWILSRSKHLLWKAWTRKGAALLAAVPVLAYGMLSGMSPSTQRAVLMVMVFLAAVLIEREYDPANTLAVAAFAILAFDPPALFNVSFQLSFAAVSAILYGLYLNSGRHRSVSQGPKRLYRKIAGFMFVSFCAIVGTMPLVMHYFNQVSVIGIVSNLFLVPLIGFIVVPVGLLSVFSYPIAPHTAILGLALSADILKPAIHIIHTLAALPFSAFKTITPSVIEIICAYILIAAVCWIFCKGRGDTDSRPKPDAVLKPVSRQLVLVLVAVTVVIFSVDILYWVHRRFFNPDLRVTVLDVGRGSSALVELPGGKCMLIDGVGFTRNDIFDVGARIVAPYLWRNKIRTIDEVILSHPDSDHLNGLLYVLAHFHVKAFISTHEPADIDEYREMIRIIRKKSIPFPDYRTVAKHQRIGGADVDLLYPPADIIRTGNFEAGKDRNNHSIVVRIAYGHASILFPGDIEAEAESELSNSAGRHLHSSILIAPHHGSKTSSTPVFLDAVHPDTVIVSTRKRRYGAPSPAVLQRYKKRGYRVLRTDTDGAVRVRIDRDGDVHIIPTLAAR